MSQVYEYRVRDQRGKILKGLIEAENKELVIGKLREQGYYITDLKEKVQSKDVSETFNAWFGVNLKDLVVFSRQFSTMISAGLPILKCLEILIKQTKKEHFKNAIQDLKRDVEAGSTLSGAMGKHPKIFPGLFVTMVHAGEVGGVLDKTLNRLAEHFEKEHELREKIKTATRYPKFVVFFAIIILLIMILFVVPNFANIFSEMQIEMPTPTRVMLGLGEVIKKYYIYIIMAGIATGYGFNRYLKTNEGKIALEKVLSSLPVFGELSLKINVSRVCRTLGTLLYSGVPILQALDAVKAIAGTVKIRQSLEKARESIREGEGMAAPLEETGAFPIMVTQMLAVGEETGNVDVMLNKVADFYEKEVSNATERLTSIIEPFLLIFLGVVVGGIVFFTIMPIFDMYGKIKVR